VIKYADDCKTIELYSTVIFNEAIPLAFGCLLQILFTAGFAVVFCRLTRTYQGIKDKHLKNVRDVLLLMCSLLISVVLDILAIVFALVMDENYAFQMFAFLGPTISMMIYPTGFFLYFYSVKKLKWESIKRTAAEWKPSCGCKQKQRRVHLGQRPATHNLATNPSSHPPVIPSSTFFAVPNTGKFSNTDTDVMARENEPLISHIDTGYNK